MLPPSARAHHDPHHGEHDRHFDEHADDGRERGARLKAKSATTAEECRNSICRYVVHRAVTDEDRPRQGKMRQP